MTSTNGKESKGRLDLGELAKRKENEKCFSVAYAAIQNATESQMDTVLFRFPLVFALSYISDEIHRVSTQITYGLGVQKYQQMAVSRILLNNYIKLEEQMQSILAKVDLANRDPLFDFERDEYQSALEVVNRNRIVLLHKYVRFFKIMEVTSPKIYEQYHKYTKCEYQIQHHPYLITCNITKAVQLPHVPIIVVNGRPTDTAVTFILAVTKFENTEELLKNTSEKCCTCDKRLEAHHDFMIKYCCSSIMCSKCQHHHSWKDM